MNKTLVILQEECAELIHIISKIHRFGIDDRNNRERLVQEAGDVLCMLRLLVEKNIVSNQELEKALLNKMDKLKLWEK